MSAMKLSGGAVALLATAAHGIKLSATAAHHDNLQAKSTTPMHQVVNLLVDMKSRIEGDGMMEQSSYDKYACWCEDVMARKAKDIKDHKELITETQANIIKLKAEVATHAANIKHLVQDIVDNKKAMGEAKGVRDGEYEDYDGKKTEAEQCMGALEAAIKALSGAGTKAFLQTSLEKVELLSIVGGLRKVLEHPMTMNHLSNSDAEVLKSFVENPGDFTARNSGASALQVGHPFGDYAPQSTQIQGILKGMYDTFATDLEKGNADEADSTKAYEKLIRTKKAELSTLQKTLGAEEKDHSSRNLELTEAQEVLDATKEELDADEAFFVETKKGCKAKASEWNDRSDMRTQELQGVAKAIEILSSDKAQATFLNSTTTFVQLSQESHRSSSQQKRNKVISKLGGLAHRFHDYAMVQLIGQLRSGGHFDKVIVSVDNMIAYLREEEQDDIAHRDRCQNTIDHDKDEREELISDTDKNTANLERQLRKEIRIRAQIAVYVANIEQTKKDMQEMLDMRNKELKEFREGLKADADALVIMKKALKAVQSFYVNNKIPMSLIANPEYTVDPDKAPETSFSGSYGGRSDETTGIVAIMEMIMEDIQKEMDVARIEDAKSQALYLEQLAKMQAAVDAAEASKIALEKMLSEVLKSIAELREHLGENEGAMRNARNSKSTLDSDCDWVETHFQSRRDHRKEEIAGLIEAKGYLAGVEKGDDSL